MMRDGFNCCYESFFVVIPFTIRNINNTRIFNATKLLLNQVHLRITLNEAFFSLSKSKFSVTFHGYIYIIWPPCFLKHPSFPFYYDLLS
uniref:Uncharacterized protein n=1 Tax=Rhizophora mucronata TaxID=61149 RepID=A0A2P2QRM5_RHIMU